MRVRGYLIEVSRYVSLLPDPGFGVHGAHVVSAVLAVAYGVVLFVRRGRLAATVG